MGSDLKPNILLNFALHYIGLLIVTLYISHITLIQCFNYSNT